MSEQQTADPSPLDMIPEEILRAIVDHSTMLSTYVLSLTCTKYRGFLNTKEFISADYRGSVRQDAAYGAHVSLYNWAVENEYLAGDSMKYAALSGNVGMIKCVVGHGEQFTAGTFEHAITAGNIETLDWLRKAGCRITPSAVDAAIGRLDILQWIVKSAGVYPGVSACRLAAKKGHLDVLKWLITVLKVESYRETDAAAKYGHLEMLKWLRSRGCVISNHAIVRAASRGHLAILEYLVADGVNINLPKMSRKVVKHNHPEVLKWVYSVGVPLHDKCCVYAARHGDLELLQWLVANGCVLDERLYVEAAVEGRLDIIKWAFDRGLPLVFRLCDALAGGHFELATWARANGVSWTDGDTIGAIECGRLDILKWAQSTGGLQYFDVCGRAATAGEFDIVDWALAEGLPADSRVGEHAILRGKTLEQIKKYPDNCLHDAAVMAAAAGTGNVKLMKWLVSIGCPMDYRVYVEAACNDKLKAIQYARSIGCPYHCSARYAAVSRGHTRIVDWITINIK